MHLASAELALIGEKGLARRLASPAREVAEARKMMTELAFRCVGAIFRIHVGHHPVVALFPKCQEFLIGGARLQLEMRKG